MPGLVTPNGRHLLLGNKSWAVGAPAAGSVVSPTDTLPGPITALVFSQPMPAHPNAGYGIAFGRIRVTGGIGPFSYAFTAATSGNYSFLDTNGRTSATGIVRGFSSPIGAAAESLTVTVTDALGSAFTATLPVVKTTNAAAVFLAAQADNTDNVGPSDNAFYFQQWKIWGLGGDHTSTDTTAFTDASGRFRTSYGNMVPLTGTTIPAGSYPVHLTATSATTTVILDTTIVVAAAPPIGTFYFAPRLISSSNVAGTVVGTAYATTPSNGRNWSISGADVQYFSVEKLTGVVTLFKQPPPGVKSISLRLIDRAAVRTQDYVLNVQQGVALPSTNMTLSVATTLENYTRGQVVGTPAVSGMAGQPIWSMNFEEFFTSSYLPLPLFSFDTGTGATTAPGQLANYTYQLTYSATDGINTCTRTFPVPVAWKAGGPTLHVGAGMAAAHGALGFDRLRDVQRLFLSTNLGANAGATILIYPNSDPDYYANDNGSGLFGKPADNTLQAGWHGPFTMQASDLAGPMPRLGGGINDPYGGRRDSSWKAFMSLYHGDMVFKNILFSHCVDPHNSSGGMGDASAAIRKNGDTYGDFTVDGCAFIDNDDTCLIGHGPYHITIRNTEFGNNGGANPNSHGLYVGAVPLLTFDNNRSYGTIKGHNLKSRAKRSLITNSRFGDAEHGSASCQIELPQGGIHTVQNCVLHKGPNAQQNGCLQVGAETPGYIDDKRVNKLTLIGNTYIMMLPPANHFGSGECITDFGQISLLDGSESTITSTNESFYLSGVAAKYGNRKAVGKYTETGAMMLTVPPALDFSHPSTAVPSIPRLGFLNYTTDGGDTYFNMNYVQVDVGVDEIRIPRSASVGTLLSPGVSAFGNHLFSLFSATDIRINPFVSGTTAQIVAGLPNLASPSAQNQDGQYYQGSIPTYYAPAGRYAISPISIVNGLATVTLSTAVSPLPPGLDWIKVRFTAPNGTKADWRVYVVVL